MKNTKYYIAKEPIPGINERGNLLEDIKTEGKTVHVRCLGSCAKDSPLHGCPCGCTGKTTRNNLVDITLYQSLKQGDPVSIEENRTLLPYPGQVAYLLPLYDDQGERNQYPIVVLGGLEFSPSGISKSGAIRIVVEEKTPKEESPIEEITDQPEDATPKKECPIFKEKMSDEQLLVMKFLEELIPRLVKDNKNHLACAGEANGTPFCLEVHFGNKEDIVEVMLKNLLDKFAGGIK